MTTRGPSRRWSAPSRILSVAPETEGTLRYSEDRQIIDAGFVLTDELRAELGDLSFGGLDPQRPGLFETFHTDDTYTERPGVGDGAARPGVAFEPRWRRPVSSTCGPPTISSMRR